MYFVKIAPREYAEGSLCSFYRVEIAGEFIKAFLSSAVPNENGKLPIVTVWEESEADADPKGEEAEGYAIDPAYD